MGDRRTLSAHASRRLDRFLVAALVPFAYIPDDAVALSDDGSESKKDAAALIVAAERRKRINTERQTMADPDDLESVFQTNNPIEAFFVKNLLEREGIKGVVSEPNEPLAGLTIAESNVLVREADMMAARKVIEAYNQDLEQRAERENWTCPKCGENVPRTFDECFSCGAGRPA